MIIVCCEVKDWLLKGKIVWYIEQGKQGEKDIYIGKEVQKGNDWWGYPSEELVEESISFWLGEKREKHQMRQMYK